MRRRIRRGHVPPPETSQNNSSRKIVRDISRPDIDTTQFKPLTTKVSIQPNTVRNANNPTIKRSRTLRPLIEKTSSQGNCHPIFSKSEAHHLKDIMFVAYYTNGTAYQDEAKKLITSLQKLELNYDVVGVPSLGSWQANTRFKAKFMQQMLLKHKDMNLVYVDVDAVVHSIPLHFKNYVCDIGIRFQDFKWKQNECLSGTIYMANNPKTLKLCKEWEELNIKEQHNYKNLEQWNLGSVIEKLKGPMELDVVNLPPEYTFIFDTMKKMYPSITPVIEHFQASRRNKNIR